MLGQRGFACAIVAVVRHRLSQRALTWLLAVSEFVLRWRTMSRQEVLDRLRENERALRARSVMHAALFGSRARGDDRPGSDTDIMIEVDPDAPISVYDYVG